MGALMLVDTDVLIWSFRGRESARAAIDGASPVALSIITYMELVQGVHNKNELQRLRASIRTKDWHLAGLTEEVGARATTYLEAYALIDGLGLADALIAATATLRGDALLTANVRHYRCIPGLVLVSYVPD